MTDNAPKVYAAINAVQGKLAKTGIAKDRRAGGGGISFNFRGIDDVYAALAPLLAEEGLTIVPRLLSREVVERANHKGTAIFYVTVKAEYVITATEDGSSITACVYGEAMDTGDKATNKAMSAAYKYLCFQTFCIPTEGDNDTEMAHHEVRSAATRHKPAFDNDQASAVFFKDLIGKVESVQTMPELKDIRKLNRPKLQEVNQYGTEGDKQRLSEYTVAYDAAVKRLEGGEAGGQ